MKATLVPLLDVLGRPRTRFAIPVFQRVYSWTERQCAQMLDDALRADAGADAMHFMGTLIYLPEGEHDASLIDGQQRLVTLSLLLVALRDRLACGSADERALAASIDEAYLRSGADAKLMLAEADAATFDALVRGEEAQAKGGDPLQSKGEGPSRFLVDNLGYLARRLDEVALDAAAILAALHRLVVVAVELEEDDAPQQVFESLNAKGKPLSTTDLLRNTLLLRYGFDEQERLFGRYWAPIDAAFAAFAPEEDVYLDAALHAWLVEAAPGIGALKRSDLYQAFKDHLAQEDDATLEGMLRSISSSCLAFAAEPASQTAREHLDWAIGKQKGLVSERMLFGD